MQKLVKLNDISLRKFKRTRKFLHLPVVIIYGSQILATVIIFTFVYVIKLKTDTLPNISIILIIQGIVAAFFGFLFSLSNLWAIIQFFIPLSVYYIIGLNISSWFWLILFILTYLIFKNSVFHSVPLYLSNTNTWFALEKLLPNKKGVKFVDLGGGIGGTALHISKTRPDAEIISVESAPIPALISYLRNYISELTNVEMRYGNLWEVDLREIDLAYAFLSPVPMEQLLKKVKEEMKPGSIFVSNTFNNDTFLASEILELDDRRKTKLYLWRL